MTAANPTPGTSPRRITSSVLALSRHTKAVRTASGTDALVSFGASRGRCRFLLVAAAWARPPSSAGA